MLVDEGRYGPPGELKPVKCRTEWINFSSHCSGSNLIGIVKGLRGNPKVLCIHGEAASCTALAERVKQETGLEAFAPSLSESFKL
jgi:predicted metal-dependent RNase